MYGGAVSFLRSEGAWPRYERSMNGKYGWWSCILRLMIPGSVDAVTMRNVNTIIVYSPMGIPTQKGYS